MKAMLACDMPKSCWDCHLVDEHGNCIAIKISSEKYGMDVRKYADIRPFWCPIVPLPSKRKSVVEWYNTKIETATTVKTHDFTEYDKGWNDCVDFLEGEDND